MDKKSRHFIQYLEAQRAELERLSKAASKKPSPSVVHQLRITIRRTRAALWVLRQSSDQLVFKALDHNLRQLGKVLGVVRELDVAISDAKNYALDPSPLKPKRKRCLKSIRQFVTAKQRNKRSKKMAKLAKVLRIESGVDLNQARVTLNGRMESLNSSRIPGCSKLHQFRIAVKKARYSLEAIGKPIQTLKHLQKCLGDARDLEVLEGLLGKNPAIERKRSRLNTKALHLAKPALQATLQAMNT